jgi:hypothetical protein
VDRYNKNGALPHAQSQVVPRKRTTGQPPAKLTPASTVYRLKIALEVITPQIWRRVEVTDCTLGDLHEVIQRCMPWYGDHLWDFVAGRSRFSPAPEEGGRLGMDGATSAYEIRLSELVAAGVKHFRYTYDFGDSWVHKIIIEKVLPKTAGVRYPLCTDGARAGPPEDCGGFFGYSRLVDAVADPNVPRDTEWIQWGGKPFDPEAFDIEAIHSRLSTLKLSPVD